MSNIIAYVAVALYKTVMILREPRFRLRSRLAVGLTVMAKNVRRKGTTVKQRKRILKMMNDLFHERETDYPADDSSGCG